MRKLGKKVTLGGDPIIRVNWDALYSAGITKDDVASFIPPWISACNPIQVASWKYSFFQAMQAPVNFILRRLEPREEPGGNLGEKEVEAVYTRQATRYDFIHHITTFGTDDVWRFWMAVSVMTLAQKKKLRHLDICTGTGLTAKKIRELLEQNGFGGKVDTTCLDYTEAMLNVARVNLHGLVPPEKIVRGDVTRLTTADGENFARFDHNCYDVVTQMCGIGGIKNVIDALTEVLKVVNEGGVFILHDMHEANPKFPRGFYFLWKELMSAAFEKVAWGNTGLEALKRLWAWHYTTADFYLARLVTYQEDGSWYGFEVADFNHFTHRWWLGLPIMPVAREVLLKVNLTSEEAEKRQAILSACSFTRLPS